MSSQRTSWKSGYFKQRRNFFKPAAHWYKLMVGLCGKNSSQLCSTNSSPCKFTQKTSWQPIPHTKVYVDYASYFSILMVKSTLETLHISLDHHYALLSILLASFPYHCPHTCSSLHPLHPSSTFPSFLLPYSASDIIHECLLKFWRRQTWAVLLTRCRTFA